MQDIPAEVATLLKSRSMVGGQAPSYRVSIGGVYQKTSGNITYTPSNPANYNALNTMSAYTVADAMANNYFIKFTIADYGVDGYGTPYVIWNYAPGNFEIDNGAVMTIANNTATFNYNAANLATNSKQVNISFYVDSSWPLSYVAKVMVQNLLAQGWYFIDNTTQYNVVRTSDNATLETNPIDTFTATINTSQGSSTSQQIPVKSIAVDRSKSTTAGSATVVIDNAGGWASPDTPGGVLNGLTKPGQGIVIELGYGLNLVTAFTGIIDRSNPKSFPQELDIDARDMMKQALDQYIMTATGSYQVTFANVSPEYIFQQLAQLAGWSLNQIGVDATGIIISKKTFQWESYGDAFSWLCDITGYEVYCNEVGSIYFKDPVAGIPVSSPVYSFTEGVDIIKVDLVLDDQDQYRTVIGLAATGGTKTVTVTRSDGTSYTSTRKTKVTIPAYWHHPDPGDYNLLPGKAMKLDVQESVDQTNLQKIVNNVGAKILARARQVQWACVGNPWIQIGDSVNIKESSTNLNAIYRILDIQHQLDDQGFISTFTGYKYQ